MAAHFVTNENLVQFENDFKTFNNKYYPNGTGPKPEFSDYLKWIELKIKVTSTIKKP